MTITASNGMRHELTDILSQSVIVDGDSVRRLTPGEHLRCQGFPGDHLDGLGIPDSAKYKMIGNSMAVPVMQWIGERIDMVESLDPR